MDEQQVYQVGADGFVSVPVPFTEEEYERIQKYADYDGVSIQDFLVDGINMFLELLEEDGKYDFVE